MQRAKKSSIYIFISVIFALFLLEVQVRFGSKRLGYLWGLIDPMTKVLMFALIKILLGITIPGLDFPVFLAVSFFWYEFLRRFVMSSMHIFEANKTLYHYDRVFPIDVLLASWLVELVNTLISFVVFLLGLYYLGLDISVDNFMLLSLSILWFSIFIFAIGLFSAVMNSFYKNYQKFMIFVFTPLMFTSALFYSLERIPRFGHSAIQYLQYNPVVHFMELIHAHYFQVLTTRYVDYHYIVLWTIIPLLSALFLYKKSEKKIVGL